MTGLLALTLTTGTLSTLAQDIDSDVVDSDVNPADAEQPALSAEEQLDLLLENLQTFRADVRQLIVENTGGVLEESEILFMLKRPHGF